jgi:glycosyltransferase involved in cell wall biosynthesis
MADSRPHVLVIPQQLPQRPTDIGGVFSLDYVAAIEPHCRVTVLAPGEDDRRGLARTRKGPGAAEHVTWTPRLSGGLGVRGRLRRLEVLYELGRLDRFVEDVDLIHAHGPVFHGVPGSVLGAKLGVPVVLTVHTGPFSKLLRRPAARWLTRRTLERVDCVCAVSHHLQRQIEDAGIKPRRIDVTYNPVDTELFRPPQRPRLPQRRIAFAGRLEEYKGGMRVLRAFAQIADRWPAWTLLIAGDGPERGAMEQFLRSHPGVAGQVRLLGSATKPQLADLFAESDYLVCPSRHESFGLVLAEAMSAGLPVIGPNCTAPPEFIDATSGVLVPPDDIPAIASAMEDVMTRLPTYRPELIRETIVRRFGLAAFGRRLLALYDDLRNERREAVGLVCAE